MNQLILGLIGVIGFILVIGCAPGEILDVNKLKSETKDSGFGYYYDGYATKDYGVKWEGDSESIIFCEDALLNSKTREICSNHGYDYRIFYGGMKHER